ncbi:transmembrane protein 179-like [Asterias amurensis]|uniref:transmembrane protein 179-like n=1 Tax=Asterias amurensis TaxID=7602 RepID=UPI003AB2CB52
MAGLKSALLGFEVLLLLTALGAGLAATASLFLSRQEIEGSDCLLYGNFNWTGAAVVGDKAKCDFSLFAQIVVSGVALVSALYRCLSIPCEKLDLVCFRVLSVIIYGLSAAFVLIESVIVHVGVEQFCESMTDNPIVLSNSTCQSNQDLFNTLMGSEANFYGDLRISAVASWVSLGTWLVLTGVALISICVRDDDKNMA